MSSTRSSISLNVIVLSLFRLLISKPKQQHNQIYDYTQHVGGRDYIFESVDNLTQGYMTGQGKNIKRGDYIILQNGTESSRYQVEEINYYSDPPDMWMAFLKKVMIDSL
jgi:hypothetical protein